MFITVQAKAGDFQAGGSHIEGEGIPIPWLRGTKTRVSPVLGALAMGVFLNLRSLET